MLSDMKKKSFIWKIIVIWFIWDWKGNKTDEIHFKKERAKYIY